MDPPAPRNGQRRTSSVRRPANSKKEEERFSTTINTTRGLRRRTVVVGGRAGRRLRLRARSVMRRGGSGATASAGSKLTIAAVAPFTGADAALGPKYWSRVTPPPTRSTRPAASWEQVKCKTVDTRGDPADAVPAVRQMYATTGNLSLVIGCTSDEAASVVPIFGAHKTVSFCMTGQSEFDHVKFPYFFRLVPPDLSESYAMVQIAKSTALQEHRTGVRQRLGSQTFIAPAIAAIKKAGDERRRRTRRSTSGRPRSGPRLTRSSSPARRDPHGGARARPRRRSSRGQAAQRRQDDPDDRYLGDDLAGLVQVGVQGRLAATDTGQSNFGRTTWSPSRPVRPSTRSPRRSRAEGQGRQYRDFSTY